MKTTAKLGVFFLVLAATAFFSFLAHTEDVRSEASKVVRQNDSSATDPPMTKVAHTDEETVAQVARSENRGVISSALAKVHSGPARSNLAKSHPKASSKETSNLSKQVLATNASPKRTLTDLNAKHANVLGKQMQLGTPGKWTVVHFWATWCNACVQRSPDLVKLHSKYAPHGVEFFGVNLDKDSGVAANYMTKVGLVWPQMMTKDGWESSIRLEYEVPTIPAVYLVSPSGRVVEAGMGDFADADMRLKFHLSGRSSR